MKPDVLDPEWADYMVGLLAKRPQEGSAIAQGSLWVSRSTQRRCVVLWASQGQVGVSFNDSSTSAQKVFSEPAFLRLYSEV